MYLSVYLEEIEVDLGAVDLEVVDATPCLVEIEFGSKLDGKL